MSDRSPPWLDILATARDLVGVDACTLMIFDNSEELLMLQQVDVDQTTKQEYRHYFYKEDTLIKAVIIQPAIIWLDNTKFLPANVSQKNAFHADFLPKNRVDQVLAFQFPEIIFKTLHSTFSKITPKI